jgi:hypothetical protein
MRVFSGLCLVLLACGPVESDLPTIKPPTSVVACRRAQSCELWGYADFEACQLCMEEFMRLNPHLTAETLPDPDTISCEQLKALADYVNMTGCVMSHYFGPPK